jgi:hypothetical protein
VKENKEVKEKKRTEIRKEILGCKRQRKVQRGRGEKSKEAKRERERERGKR